VPWQSDDPVQISPKRLAVCSTRREQQFGPLVHQAHLEAIDVVAVLAGEREEAITQPDIEDRRKARNVGHHGVDDAASVHMNVGKADSTRERAVRLRQLEPHIGLSVQSGGPSPCKLRCHRLCERQRHGRGNEDPSHTNASDVLRRRAPHNGLGWSLPSHRSVRPLQ